MIDNIPNYYEDSLTDYIERRWTDGDDFPDDPNDDEPDWEYPDD